MNHENKIRVLVVDDSSVVRQTLAEVLQSDPRISVMATASDPFIAAAKIRDEVPDVITLDVEMPRMDGLTFLQKIVSRHRPSVDVLFRSAARYAGRNAIGVIMTGMGDDGAKGMLEMKEAGAHNIVQDEETCIVFGMPHEAIKRGAVDAVLPIHGIAGRIIKECS